MTGTRWGKSGMRSRAQPKPAPAKIEMIGDSMPSDGSAAFAVRFALSVPPPTDNFAMFAVRAPIKACLFDVSDYASSHGELADPALAQSHRWTDCCSIRKTYTQRNLIVYYGPMARSRVGRSSLE